MTLTLRLLGDEILRTPAEPVRKVNQEIKALIEEMFETMRASNGIGLAAPQVGVSKRVIVVDIGEGQPMALVNPVIVKSEGSQTADEGCLSIPRVILPVTRSTTIKVEARTHKDRFTVFVAKGLLARAIQHEIDHLDGKLFIDRVTDKGLVANQLLRFFNVDMLPGLIDKSEQGK